MLLLIRSGNVELNPGPDDNSIGIMHLNIRSIRNKLEFIKENYSDFDIISFTETHLDDTVPNDKLGINNYGQFFRNDISSHSYFMLLLNYLLID